MEEKKNYQKLKVTQVTSVDENDRSKVFYDDKFLKEVQDAQLGMGRISVKDVNTTAKTKVKCLLCVLQALVYEDGQLVSGSLDALVQHLVPTQQYYPDVSTATAHYTAGYWTSARLALMCYALLTGVFFANKVEMDK